MSSPSDIEVFLVCHNIDCKLRGSVEIGDEIAQRLADAGSEVPVKPYLCFGACQEGPNMVVYPEGTWYMGVQQSDADEIAQHIMGGQAVTRLTEKVDPALRDLIVEILKSGIVQF